MTATSGRILLDLYKSSGRVGCLAKMLLATSRWASMTCWLTWKDWATPGKRLLFRLYPSMPDIDEIDSGLLPTPTAQSYGSNQSPSDGAAVRPSLETMARRGWFPTPVARDGIFSRFTQEQIDKTADERQDSLTRVVRGPLNPVWVEWLMGYPSEWTALEPLAMQSSRKSRKKSSAP
jgi:hypothetical protein